MQSTPDSITIAVAALNEEAHLQSAVDIVVRAARRHFDDYEIIVYNDGSTDRTGEIADALAEKYPSVTAVHHDHPQCLGGVIRSGLARARGTYFMWVDGKGATTEPALDAIFSHRSEADLVVPYPSNQHERPWSRRVISRAFVLLLNTLFRLRLKYYTHVVLCRTAQARQFTVRTNSYAYQAEALIKMIKSGCSYVHVGVEDRYDQENRRTKAFKLNNVTRVAGFLLRTFWDVYIVRRLRHAPAKPSKMEEAPLPVTHHATAKD
jgi:glycosyltransferase involved in cell wall biosynthesis